MRARFPSSPLFAVTLVVVLAAAAGLTSPRVARAQADLERFNRQLEQIRRDTILSIDTDVPVEQRALFDYGAFLSFNYLSIDDSINDNHVLRLYEAVGYARVNLDGASELFIRGRVGYEDFNNQDSFDDHGDGFVSELDLAYYRFDLSKWYDAKGKPPPDLGFAAQVGRNYVYWANGLTLSQTLDGGIVDLSYHATTLQLVAGVTPKNTVDIDSSRPHFDDNTTRGFYGAVLTQDLGAHRPFVYGLVQQDYNSDDVGFTGGVTTNYDYNSYYLGLGTTGSITDKLLYGVEVVYEGGNNLSNSFTVSGPNLVQAAQTRDDISAFAGDARLDYLFNDRRKSRLSAEVIIASGDSDRFSSSTNTFGGNRPNTTDNGFIGFGLLNTGLAFAPSVSNVFIVRVGALTFPLPDNSALDKLQIGTDLFLYNKFSTNAPIDEPTTDDRYLGFEPDLFLNWQVTSDVTIVLRYGIFFPGPAILSTDDKPRQFIGAGLTYAF